MKNKKIYVTAILTLFNFVFLGTEYLFDNRMALYTDPTGVVLAQSYILGVSALGFLAYSLIEKWKSKSGNPTAFKAVGFFLSGPVIADSLICLPCAALAACFLR